MNQRDSTGKRDSTGQGDDLVAIPMLAVLPVARLRELADAFPVRRHGPRTVLARRGERAERLVVVHAGRLAAVQDTADGDRIRFDTVEGPCVVDKAAVLSGGAYDASWVAETTCRVRRIDAATFARLLDEEPALRDHVVRHLAGQVLLSRADRARREDTPVRRIASWLAEAAARQGDRVVLPGAQQGLGERLGLSRITVNRALRTLARDGAIRTGPGTVHVLDPARLAGWTLGRPDQLTR